MSEELFEKALGVESPWEVESVTFDQPEKRLTISISFATGTRFSCPKAEGLHPVHDTVTKRYRHLNFFSARMHSGSAFAARASTQWFRVPG
jgi:hypothetical protein